MTITSMTGFARDERGDDRGSWLWEVRSVNSRGLDLRVKLPPGLDRLEQPARAAAKARSPR